MTALSHTIREIRIKDLVKVTKFFEENQTQIIGDDGRPMNVAGVIQSAIVEIKSLERELNQRDQHVDRMADKLNLN